jgi:hypothetical protein
MSDSDKSDTVELYGMKDGIQVHLGQAPMPPRMKAKEIVVSVFGHFDEHDDMDDGDAALCFSCMTELIDYMIKQERTQITQLQAEVDAMRKDGEHQDVLSKKDLWWSLQSLAQDMEFNAGRMREILVDDAQMITHAKQLEGAAEIAKSWIDAIDAAIKGEQAA